MMAETFTRKRVDSLTLGEKLKKMRSDHRISLGEVSRSTKIQVRYLEALESGQYDKLPPDVYIRGFLRSYAAFLGVPEDAILKLYERERSIQRNLGHVGASTFDPRTPISFSWSVSPKALVFGAIVLLLGLFFSYLYFELKAFISEPRLSVFEPLDQQVVTDAYVTVRGETDRFATVTINGEGIAVDEEGVFSERLILGSGVNALEVSSTNRFGKKRTRVISVRVDGEESSLPQDNEAFSSTELSRDIPVSVRAIRETSVSVRVDGQVVFNGKMSPNETKIFQGSETVSVSADIADAVFVKFDEGAEEPLGNAGPAEAVFGKDGRVSDEGSL